MGASHTARMRRLVCAYDLRACNNVRLSRVTQRIYFHCNSHNVLLCFYNLQPWYLANNEIVLCWIPSHICFLGNEMVEQQAKSLLSLEPTSFNI